MEFFFFFFCGFIKLFINFAVERIDIGIYSVIARLKITLNTLLKFCYEKILSIYLFDSCC